MPGQPGRQSDEEEGCWVHQRAGGGGFSTIPAGDGGVQPGGSGASGQASGSGVPQRATQWATLELIIPQLQASSYPDFTKKVMATEHKSWFLGNMNRNQFKSYVMNYIDAHKTELQYKMWKDIMAVDLKPALHEKLYGEYVSVEESSDWLDKICAHNGWDPEQFTRDVKQVVDREKPKVNTLLLLGPPNSGKKP